MATLPFRIISINQSIMDLNYALFELLSDHLSDNRLCKNKRHVDISNSCYSSRNI